MSLGEKSGIMWHRKTYSEITVNFLQLCQKADRDWGINCNGKQLKRVRQPPFLPFSFKGEIQPQLVNHRSVVCSVLLWLVYRRQRAEVHGQLTSQGRSDCDNMVGIHPQIWTGNWLSLSASLRVWASRSHPLHPSPVLQWALCHLITMARESQWAILGSK